MVGQEIEITTNEAMFNKLLKSFGKKISKREVEDFIRSFESLEPNQVATQLIAVYSIYIFLAQNEEFVEVIQSTGPGDAELIHNAIIQLSKLLNENPYSPKGNGLKFWLINLRCIRDKELKQMEFSSSWHGRLSHGCP